MTPVFEIPGIPEPSCQRLTAVLLQQPGLEQVWLFGSRAMGRHRPGSDLDLCLIGDAITHQDRLRLMHAIDELLLPWSVDLALWHELPEDLRGICSVQGDASGLSSDQLRPDGRIFRSRPPINPVDSREQRTSSPRITRLDISDLPP